MKTRTFRETLSRQVIDPDTRERWITLTYMALTCLMMMHHVYVTVFFATVENGAITFRYPWVFLAGVTFLMGRMWKDRCCRLLSALLLIKILRVAIPMPAEAWELQSIWWLCIYAFYVCYGAGRALNRKDRETLIRWFCGLWTLAMAVFSCLGLYAVWNNAEIPNLGTSGFYINPSEHRLWPVFHPVEGGAMTAISIGVAMVGFFMTRRKILRGCYALAAAAMLTAGAFCVSRTSYVLTALGICTPVCLMLHEALEKRKRPGKGPALLRAAAVCAVFAALALGLVFLQMRIVPAVQSLQGRGTPLISAAAAEETAPAAGETETAPPAEDAAEAEEAAAEEAEPAEEAAPEEETEPEGPVTVSTRDFVTNEGFDGFLTGRYEIWFMVCSGISHYPIYALIGQGVYEPMAHLNDFIRGGLALGNVYHLHSTFIQTLWESGIPGFLLFFAFFVIFLRNAFELIRDRDLPAGLRLIPVPALLCWLADMVDMTGYCNWGKPPMTILYFFTGVTIAIARENRKRRTGRTQS